MAQHISLANPSLFVTFSFSLEADTQELLSLSACIRDVCSWHVLQVQNSLQMLWEMGSSCCLSEHKCRACLPWSRMESIQWSPSHNTDGSN